MNKEFDEVVNNKCDGNEDWCGLKRKLDVANDVCGYNKDKPTYFATWWLNKDVDVTVCRKRLVKIWKESI